MLAKVRLTRRRWTKSAGNGRIGRGGAIPLPGRRRTFVERTMSTFADVFGELVFYIITLVPHRWMSNPHCKGPSVGRPGRKAVRTGGYYQQG